MLNPADTDFAQALTKSGIAHRPATPHYVEELRGRFKGISTLVAFPQTTDEVSRVVKLCHAARVGIVPFGGGTGLVGGQVAVSAPAPLVISLERLDRVRAIHREENTLVAEAGVTLTKLHDTAEDAGRLFPLTYASKDSARIGSALAVNSGGLNVLRYGTARDLCLGIEAVLPDGEILKGLRRLRKDNTGYDLRNLLIGSEGTLGIITAATLKLFPRPARTGTAYFAVSDPTAALELLALFHDRAGNSVSAFELLSGQSFAFLGETHPDLRQPFETPPNWAVLVELGTGPGIDPEAVLADVFEAALAEGLVQDARVAQGGQQRDDYWAVRETIPEANRRIGAIASHDIALPLSALPVFLMQAEARLEKVFPMRINAFGHLGDGNLHYNIFPPKGASSADYKDRSAEVSRIIHDLVHTHDGTFSAEHGVGRAKTGELQRYGDPAKLAAMKSIKQALDPLGIMNPGAVLPEL